MFHESSAKNGEKVAAGDPEQRERSCCGLFEGLSVTRVRGLWELAPISKVRSRSDRNRPLASISKLGPLSIQNRKVAFDSTPEWQWIPSLQTRTQPTLTPPLLAPPPRLR